MRLKRQWKSTLGKALAEKLNFYFIDNEELFFPKTDPFFQKKTATKTVHKPHGNRVGEPPGNRTRDTLLKRQVLCRLS